MMTVHLFSGCGHIVTLQFAVNSTPDTAFLGFLFV